MIEATTPNRIDLAGGTLDLYPLYLFEEYGVTVNMAIDLGSRARVETREDDEIHIVSEDTEATVIAPNVDALEMDGPLSLIARAIKFYRPPCGINVYTHNKAPKGTGLGSSSSLLIALSAALYRLNKTRLNPTTLIDHSANLEAQNIRIPTGKQDYYAAVHGGVQRIHFRVDGHDSQHLITDEKKFRALEDRIVLSFTGESRFSGTSNWNMIKMYIENLGTTVENLRQIKKTAIALAECLERWDLKRLPELLDEEWQNRKNLADGVTTPKIEKIIAATLEAGAKANKICGAGGGGALITYTEPKKRVAVEEALVAAGARVLPYKISRQGLRVRTLPNGNAGGL